MEKGEQGLQKEPAAEDCEVVFDIGLDGPMKTSTQVFFFHPVSEGKGV
jgi:hypothetical protein